MDQVIVDIPRFGEAIRIALKADSYSGTGMVAVDSIFFDVPARITHPITHSIKYIKGKICQSIAFSGKSGVSGVRGSTRPSALASDYPNPTALQHSIPDESNNTELAKNSTINM
jgi:hypothetical protein